MGLLEIVDGFRWDSWWISFRYLLGLLEIFDGCPGDIWWVCLWYL